MARLDKPERFQRLAEPVAGDRDALQRWLFLLPIVFFRGPGHSRRSLAAGDDNDFPVCRSVREVAWQAFRRQGSRDGGVEKGLKKACGV